MIKTAKKILFCGTTSSGSSGVFDYFRCFPTALGFSNEFPKEFRKGIYAEWKKQGFTDSDKYAILLHELLEQKFLEDFPEMGEDNIYLLNNIISCLTLNAVELLDNVLILCILRDPRSTWLRRKELVELSGNTIEVEQFIKEFREQRSLFESHLQSLRRNRECVHIVHYEEFILKPQVRINLAKFLGFDINDYPENPDYAPYPPEQNVWWHHSYSATHELDKIKLELGKYCHPLAERP